MVIFWWLAFGLLGRTAGLAIVVIGSLNIDITIDVQRLPTRGETVIARRPSVSHALGGKGANQAVAVARLVARTRPVRFVGQLGNDGHAAWLETVLAANGLDLSACNRSQEPSGQGYVMLEQDGSVASIVVSGANGAWPEKPSFDAALQGAGLLMLQREVPEHVNQAAMAAAASAGAIVLQDVGGEDRPMSEQALVGANYLCPNESELQRLTKLPTASQKDVVTAAQSLQARGARNVLVTLGARGAILILSNGTVLTQPTLPVPGGAVLDTTAAGDAFRAAFAVGLAEGKSLPESLALAAAAGAIAVSKRGAEPSLPSREDCDALLATQGAETPETCVEDQMTLQPLLPKFASRLNSMKARMDLWPHGDSVESLLMRQASSQGLSLVYFNYPEHLQGKTPATILSALHAASESTTLRTGGVALRFPRSMRLGAFTNPDKMLHERAVQLAIEGCQWAKDLGGEEVVVWPQTDGYDYSLQIDYPAAWQRAVEAFQQMADAPECRHLKISLEFKPTDEVSRFAVVPSTGAALLFINDVQRENVGLTLDYGHLLMAGENPGQSVAMVAVSGKLFGLHLNDGHSRLGAEDGLMFGSVHRMAALEVVYWLQRTTYSGSIYFDTFPLNEDPVLEAQTNIRTFTSLWEEAWRRSSALATLLSQHDVLGVRQLLEPALL